MKKIKDFFYNKNDIIVVLLILAAAAFVICNRMEVVMDYPDANADSISQSVDKHEADTEKKTGTADKAELVKVVIKEDNTLSDIAAELEKKGLVKSADAFVDFAIEKKKENFIIADTYEIKKGSTADEILNEITK
ncbi:MAG: hypothetical protein Q4C80_07150 [Bacillota bacterium]|nr:hypothetical protein [Bacillota bacterium]